MSTEKNDKPVLLRAVELILADPKVIHQQAQALLAKFKKAHKSKTHEEHLDLTAKQIISNYSYFSAFTGGATALSGVIPGLGTVLAVFGGAAADAALSMKYQIEMTMALASIYGHNILIEEEQRICLIVAGVGALGDAAKDGAKGLTSKAVIKITQQYLKGSTLVAVKEIFKKLGVTFTRKAVEKTIPFGVGVVIGFIANKGLTWYVGTKARDFFATTG